MHSCRLHGAEIHSTRVLFCIINQSDYDPGRDRTRDQWYRSCTPYHKATAAVVLARKLGTFILYIFIPRSVKNSCHRFKSPWGVGKSAKVRRFYASSSQPILSLALPCIAFMSCHVMSFLYIWVYGEGMRGI